MDIPSARTEVSSYRMRHCSIGRAMKTCYSMEPWNWNGQLWGLIRNKPMPPLFCSDLAFQKSCSKTSRVSGKYSWDSQSVPDGLYEIRAVTLDATGRDLGEAARLLRVNNAATFHAGHVAANETWSSQTIHVVEQAVVVTAGVTITIVPGTVVKFSPQTSIIWRKAPN